MAKDEKVEWRRMRRFVCTIITVDLYSKFKTTAIIISIVDWVN